MDPGDIVVIYEDPITKKFSEGEAKLIKRVEVCGTQEYWTVKFLIDGFVTERFIELG